MLRTRISKKNAFLLVVLLCVIAALATIWPLRLYREDYVFQGYGDIQQVSEIVDEEHDAGDYFLSQYDHLERLGVYVDSAQKDVKGTGPLTSSGSNAAAGNAASSNEESGDAESDNAKSGNAESGNTDSGSADGGSVGNSSDGDSEPSSAVIPDGLHLQLFLTKDGVNTLKAEEYVDLDPAALPGYVEILTDVDLEPGETYVYLVRGSSGVSFRVGLESLELSGDETAPDYVTGFYHDTSINGLAVATRLTYREPLDKGHSALAGLAVVLTGTVLALAAVLHGRQERGRAEPDQHMTTLGAVLKYTLTPPVTAFAIFLLVCIWQQRFDERLSDNILYSIGVILTLLIILFGLWHDRSGLPDMLNRQIFRRNWLHYVISLCIALILACCTMYMNATYEELHQRALRRIVVLLLVIALCMVHGRRRSHQGDIDKSGTDRVTRAAAAGAGLHESHVNRQSVILPAKAAATEKAWSEKKAGRTTESKADRRGSSHNAAGQTAAGTPARPVLWLVLPLAALGVLMLVFANGRTWIPVMAVCYAVLYLRFFFWKDRALWLSDLSRGIIWHFCAAVIFTMLHRYYFAFIYSRFPMQYHTVTVTAYYLLIVGAAAVSLLVGKCGQVFDGARHSFWWYADRLWKEAVLFGCVCAYMLMSLSRAGVFELALFVLLSLVLVASQSKNNRQALARHAVSEGAAAGRWHASQEQPASQGKHTQQGQYAQQDPRASQDFHRLRVALGTFGWMLLAVICVFPAVFTNQRLISTISDRPVWYEEVEPYPDEVVRHPSWDDKWFMSWEVFLRDFGDRVIGGEVGSRIYDHFDWGAHQKVEKAEDWVVNQIAQAADTTDRLLSATKQSFPVLLLSRTDDAQSATLEEGDYSNGRLLVWQAYLSQLNWTGHDTMGATLPDGTVAVHAHNNILQLAYDCGIPAGLLFLLVQILIIVGSGIYYGKQQAAVRVDGALMQLLMILGFTITGMVEWTWTFCNPFCLMYMLTIAPLLVRQD